MKTLLLATRNEGKMRELLELFEGLGVAIETLDSHSDAGEVEETGKTFEDNASLKAREYALRTGRWTIAEDSGLVVDALGGEPGVHSARYAGEHGDDAANNAKLISEMEGIGERRARYSAAPFSCARAALEHHPTSPVDKVRSSLCAQGEGARAPAHQ